MTRINRIMCTHFLKINTNLSTPCTTFYNRKKPLNKNTKDIFLIQRDSMILDGTPFYDINFPIKIPDES
ncbi:hypothetical protein BpHYR1_029609 [Brachionus plicatilis]|uniref:Uncharacterized protein n=1 Tax=Brachionus plicatilis TaxID=10195 RepID=A0A3M7RPQ3_BRAPC|nr:hypothetical protein BpHYR1_029609 [Brachionus plicatilis]